MQIKSIRVKIQGPRYNWPGHEITWNPIELREEGWENARGRSHFPIVYSIRGPPRSGFNFEASTKTPQKGSHCKGHSHASTPSHATSVLKPHCVRNSSLFLGCYSTFFLSLSLSRQIGAPGMNSSNYKVVMILHWCISPAVPSCFIF